MSICRTGIVLDGPDALSVTVSGLGGSTVTAIEPIQLTGQSPEEVVELIRAMKDDRPHQRGQIRLVLPHETCECFLRVQSAPLPDEAVLGDSIRWLEEECGFDPQAYDIRANAWFVRGRQAVAISAMDRGLLTRYQSSLESAGMHDVVVVSPLDALVQMAMNTAREVAAANRVLIHVGRATTALLAVEEGLPVFFRSLSHNVKCDAITQPGVGAPQFQITEQEADRLANELGRTLQFYQQTAGAGRRVEHMTLSATNLDLRRLVATLQQQTGATVALAGASLVQMPSGDSDGTVDMLGEQRLALPLAVSAVRQMPEQSRMVYTPSRTRRMMTSQSTHWGLLVAFIVVLVLVWLVIEAGIAATHSKGASLQAQERDLVKQLNDRNQEQEKRTNYVDNVNVLLQMKQQGVLASDMMSAANNLRPRDVVFDRVALDAKPQLYTLRVTGSIPDVPTHDALAMLDEYTAHLANQDLFEHTFVEKPQLDGPGSDGELNRRNRGGDDPGDDASLTFTLVLQSVTPWQVQGEGKP